MKYQHKLYGALVGTALSSIILGLGIAYFQTEAYFLEELRSKVMSIAGATAATLDANLLKQVRSENDEKSSTYKKLQESMRAVRNASRRDDVYVKFIYTLIPRKEDTTRFYYQIDAEEATPDFSHFGDEVPDAQDALLSLHLNEIYSPKHFVTNQWGTWMTGFAPIYDKSGRYVATLAVDLQASDVVLKLNRLLEFGAFSFGGALLLALLFGFYLSSETTRSLDSLSKGVEEIGRGNLSKRIDLTTSDEFGKLANAVNAMAKGLQERERLSLNFSRYVSQYVMESILKSEAPLKLQGERRKITLLFADIRQFTKLSEKLPPEEVVALLNEYFAVMVEIIFKNQGTLDKFLGDGMMIEFSVPLDDPLQELHAVNAAIEMQQGLKKLCEKWSHEGKPQIEIGIGIHTGIAIVGNIGSERRIEYTAIGDTVNVAARIEELTKELKTSILISETTVKAIEKQFSFKNLGPIILRGRVDPIIIYSLQY